MRRRFRGLFGLDPRRDVDDELSFHVEMRVRELIERGESPDRAREIALNRFGSRARPQAECLEINERRRRRFITMQFFSERLQDIRYTLRMFRRTPGVTLTAVVTLALGIGANVAIFSLFNQVLLRPLPVPAPHELVLLASPGPRGGSTSCSGMGACAGVFSYPMLRDLERIQTVFTGIAGHRDLAVNLGVGGETSKDTGLLVSGSYFPVLGIQPALGRLLEPQDTARVGGSEVVVLSHAYWKSRFGGRPTAVGQTLVVNGQAMTVVGVAPEGFGGTVPGLVPKVFVPLTMRWRVLPTTSQLPDNRRGYWIYAFARLKPGVTREQAQAAIDPPFRAIIRDVEVPLQENMSPQLMAQFAARSMQLQPGGRGQSSLSNEARAPLTLLLGITALLLLIACVNVTNLVLARAAARAKEMATRLSIGASRARLVAQLLTESSVLAFAAAGASLLVARWTLGLVDALLDNVLTVQLDAAALIATPVLAIVVSLATGLFPALQAVRTDSLGALKSQSGQAGGGRRAARLRMSLATAQVTASMVLLVLAGLFTASLARMARADPGMRIDGIVTFTISPQRNGYAPERSVALFDRIEEEIAAIPGVASVVSSSTPLMENDNRSTSTRVEGFDAGPESNTDTQYDEIGAGYFRTLGIPLIAGREFTARDSAGAPPVVIVNEQFARKFGLGTSGVGKRMSRGAQVLDLQIVGVVADAKHNNLTEAITPMFFVPHRQSERRPGFRAFFVQTSSGSAETMQAIRQAVTRLDSNLPIEKLRTMEEALRGAMTQQRLMGTMTGAFAVLATLVAGIGLYGVVAYAVSQRTPEIGLRMALGATRASVRWMVLRQVGVIAGVGGALGLGLALVLGRAAQSLLFGLQFHDAAVLGAAVAALMLVALAAGLVPASRAARVDPMRALKHQ